MKTRKEIENEILDAMKAGTMDVEGLAAVVSYFQVSFAGAHKKLRQAKKELEQVKSELEELKRTPPISVYTTTKFQQCPRCGMIFSGDVHVCWTIDTQSQTKPITVTSTNYTGELTNPPKPGMEVTIE